VVLLKKSASVWVISSDEFIEW